MTCDEQRPNPHLAWIVEWGAIDLPLGHPSRITSLSIHDDEYDAACALYDAGKEFRARMWPISLQYKGEPELMPEIAERSSAEDVCQHSSCATGQEAKEEAARIMNVAEVRELVHGLIGRATSDAALELIEAVLRAAAPDVGKAQAPSPLTDEQIDAVQRAWIAQGGIGGTGPRGFARAIEAELRAAIAQSAPRPVLLEAGKEDQ